MTPISTLDLFKINYLISSELRRALDLVRNPMVRLVNFRVSEAEFERLNKACESTGARSISDFARKAVMRSVDGDSKDSSITLGDLINRVLALEQATASPKGLSLSNGVDHSNSTSTT